MYSIHFYNGSSTTDFSKNVESPKFTKSLVGGNAVFDFTLVYISATQQIEIMQLNATYRFYIARHGSIVWSGRIISAVLENNTLRIQCNGLFHKVTDIGDFAFYPSFSDNSLWKKQTENYSEYGLATRISGSTTNKFVTDPYLLEDELLKVGLKENQGIPAQGGNGFYIPIHPTSIDYNSALYAGFIDVEVNLPANFVAFFRFSDSLPSVAVYTSTGSATRIVFGLTDVLTTPYFTVRNDTGGTYTSTLDDGTWYARIRGYAFCPRGDYSQTTASMSVSANTTAVITPASMQNIYVGKRLFILNAVTNVGESVVVTAVTATTFTAFFERAHSGTETIAVPYTKGSTIARLLANYAQLRTQLIVDSVRDIPNFYFTKTNVKQALDELAKKGNGTVPYVYGVNEQEQFYFVPKDSFATYYADIDSFSLSNSLDDITNAFTVVYRYTDGSSRSGNTLTNQVNIARVGTMRKNISDVNTVSSQLAEQYTGAVLTDSVKGSVNSAVTVSKIYSTNGVLVDPSTIVPGDRFIIRNVPITLQNSVQPFYTVETVQYDLEDNKTVFSFDKPLTSVEALVNFA